jgi:putative ABC transport system substrate-binding protein
MKRREFMALLGGAAAWPLVAQAQQAAMPVIGFLNPQTQDGYSERLRGFRQGLKDTGFIEGENLTVEYRWAENQLDRVPALAKDLVRRNVAVIAATGGLSSVLAAKVATETIPILFVVPDDPIKLGLVNSIARPTGNVTGVNFLGAEIGSKRLELLRDLLPTTNRIAVLFNPINPVGEAQKRNVLAAAQAMGLSVQIFNASTDRDIDAAFAALVRERPDALFVMPDPVFNRRRVQLVHLASRYALPAIYWQREFAEAGGLMSYGSNIGESFRQVGIYAGRILKGAKIVDLPVVQSDKFELVINHQTARLLGLTVPPSLLARADEVIE